jgi:hypothetical protein
MPMGDAVSSAMQSEENCGSVILEPKYDTLASHFYPSLGWYNGELSGSRLRFSARDPKITPRSERSRFSTASGALVQEVFGPRNRLWVPVL